MNKLERIKILLGLKLDELNSNINNVIPGKFTPVLPNEDEINRSFLCDLISEIDAIPDDPKTILLPKYKYTETDNIRVNVFYNVIRNCNMLEVCFHLNDECEYSLKKQLDEGELAELKKETNLRDYGGDDMVLGWYPKVLRKLVEPLLGKIFNKIRYTDQGAVPEKTIEFIAKRRKERADD